MTLFGPIMLVFVAHGAVAMAAVLSPRVVIKNKTDKTDK